MEEKGRKYEVISTLPVPILMVGKRRELLSFNASAEALLGRGVCGEALGQSCFRLLSGQGGPCPECPTLGAGLVKKTVKFCRSGKEPRLFHTVCTPSLDGHVVVVLRDVSKESELAEEFNYISKELGAKNVLLERREREMRECRTQLNLFLDYLPDGMARVTHNLVLKTTNSALERIFPVIEPKKCFEFFENSSPCANCPQIGGRFGSETEIVGHQSAGRYFTETMVPIQEGEGALLIFRESTKQVTLIEEIRRQRETIRRQKDLFSNLVDLMGLMQKEPDAQKVAASFMDALMGQVGARSGILLIEGHRRGGIWLTVHRGLAPAVLEGVVGDYVRQPLRSLDIATISPQRLPWEQEAVVQIPIMARAGRQLGLMLLEGEFAQEQRQVMTLYCDPMASYIHNRILTLKLEERANTDGFTGLYNRGYFERVLAEECEKANRYRIPFCAVMVDANGLKRVNDIYGHEAGDALIKGVADCLVQVARETDIVSRIGGDEFCVILPNTAQEGGDQFILRVKSSFMYKEVQFKEGVSIPISMSLGAAGSDRVPVDQVVKFADQAMYADKQQYYSTHEKCR